MFEESKLQPGAVDAEILTNFDISFYIRKRELHNEMRCLWNDCSYVCKNDFEAFRHLKRNHELREGNGKCLWKYCEYLTSNTNNLRNHVKKHFDITEGICDICKISFKWKFDLTKHLKQFHKEEPVKITNIEVASMKITVALSNTPPMSPGIAMLLN
eukprot:NODE_376_length_8513_cov_1.020086.p7 type:complete len:157 gc:universal NODE_376_length_8513_cov_1.020086:1651-1181(-)